MNVTLLTLNKPNLNGRIYTTEVVQKAIDGCRQKVDERRMFLERGYSSFCDVNLENVCGVITKLEIDGDLLVGDVEYFKQNVDLIGIPIRPKSIGTYGENNTLDHIEFLSFCITNDPA